MVDFIKRLAASKNATYTEVERLLKYFINPVSFWSYSWSYSWSYPWSYSWSYSWSYYWSYSWLYSWSYSWSYYWSYFLSYSWSYHWSYSCGPISGLITLGSTHTSTSIQTPGCIPGNTIEYWSYLGATAGHTLGGTDDPTPGATADHIPGVTADHIPCPIPGTILSSTPTLLWMRSFWHIITKPAGFVITYRGVHQLTRTISRLFQSLVRREVICIWLPSPRVSQICCKNMCNGESVFCMETY